MKLTRKLIAKELVDWAKEKKDDGFDVTIDYKENSRTIVHPRFPISWFDPYDGDNPIVYIKIKFPNNYGASIIYHQGSYGFDQITRNAYELAVLYEGDLCYDTDITNDVIGHLTLEDLDKYLEDIKNLDKTKKYIEATVFTLTHGEEDFDRYQIAFDDDVTDELIDKVLNIQYGHDLIECDCTTDEDYISFAKNHLDSKYSKEECVKIIREEINSLEEKISDLKNLIKED